MLLSFAGMITVVVAHAQTTQATQRFPRASYANSRAASAAKYGAPMNAFEEDSSTTRQNFEWNRGQYYEESDAGAHSNPSLESGAKVAQEMKCSGGYPTRTNNRNRRPNRFEDAESMDQSMDPSQEFIGSVGPSGNSKGFSQFGCDDGSNERAQLSGGYLSPRAQSQVENNWKME